MVKPDHNCFTPWICSKLVWSEYVLGFNPTKMNIHQIVCPRVKQKNLVLKNSIKTFFAPQVRAKKASVSETEEKEEEKEEAAWKSLRLRKLSAFSFFAVSKLQLNHQQPYPPLNHFVHQGCELDVYYTLEPPKLAVGR